MNKRTPVYFLALNSVPFLPYAYGILRAFCESDPLLKEKYAWRAPFFLMQNYDSILQQIDRPGVVLVSSYVWNFETHDKLVREIKKKWPDCTVIIGGNHVPEDRDGFFTDYPWYDVLVHGEGEHAISRLLRQLLNVETAREGFERIPGISFLENGRPRKTGAGIKVDALSEIPSPFLNGIFDPILADLRERGIRYVGLWETNRGCPYSCTFCDWGASTMSKIRGFDSERIAAEIRYFAQQKVEDLYICDANFGILERDLQTVDLLIQAKKQYGFPRTIRVNFAKKSDDRVLEMSRRLSQNGMLWGTTLSLQSGNAEALRAVKRVNHSFENLVSLAASYREAEIPNYTEMILGLPHETKQTFKKGLCRVLEAGLHEDIRVFELAVLPNAPLTRSTQLKDGGFQTLIKPLLPSIPGFYEEENRSRGGQPLDEFERLRGMPGFFGGDSGFAQRRLHPQCRPVPIRKRRLPRVLRNVNRRLHRATRIENGRLASRPANSAARVRNGQPNQSVVPGLVASRVPRAA
jgi:putative methyltransferase